MKLLRSIAAKIESFNPRAGGWRRCAWVLTIGGMRSLRPCLMIPLLLLAVSGCGSYDPPIQGDRTSEKYKTDLEKCRTSSAETVRLKNAATPGTWIVSPFTGPGMVRAAIRACMQHQGYVLETARD
jgi:hypothetical protein